MQVLVTGAAGMIGRKLCERLVRDGRIGDRAIGALTMIDVVAPAAPEVSPFPITAEAADITDPALAPRLIADRPDLIFHLAAVVSGEAEMDFDKGYAINLDGTRWIFEAIRRQNLASEGVYTPRVVFASSGAVYGSPFPPVIDDEFQLTPLTSYGTQKAIGELLLADYSRKGFFDGMGIRFPTICVRPGRPNAAASGFFSNIIREPLVGREATLPVPDTIHHTHASPRSAVGFCLTAATIDTAIVGPRRSLAMPGVRVSVGEQIEALRRVAGEKAVALIRRQPDELVSRIVAGWSEGAAAERAKSLGFVAETSFDDIIRAHIEDELGGTVE
jgi:nucleoside-diphosphate-sugar epimerase